MYRRAGEAELPIDDGGTPIQQSLCAQSVFARNVLFDLPEGVQTMLMKARKLLG